MKTLQAKNTSLCYILKSTHLLAVDPAQVRVPTNSNNVCKENSVLKRQKGKVDGLHSWPDHPVGLERGPPGLVEALLCAVALHGGHTAEEDTDHDGCKDELVAGDTGQSLEPSVSHVDVASEEAEPGGGHGAEDD